MSLLNKMKKASSLKDVSSLNDSILFGDKEDVLTDVPILNLAFSGSFDTGFHSGLTIFAGPSRHFKTLFGLIAMKAYLKKYPDAIALFYDSEFGTPKAYFEALDISTDRILHLPIVNIEELTHDIVKKLADIERGEKVFIFVDSVGNLASKKEAQDALDGKSVVDMTRAKALKSLFRIVTPHLTLKDLPMFVINHSYKELSLYPRDIMSGGCVVKGTKIKMADGSHLEIENVKVGDKVLTKDGIGDVYAVWNPETLLNGNPETYEIEFEDGHKIICSDNHKFLINDQWVEAKNMSIGDDVKTI